MISQGQDAGAEAETSRGGNASIFVQYHIHGSVLEFTDMLQSGDLRVYRQNGLDTALQASLESLLASPAC